MDDEKSNKMIDEADEMLGLFLPPDLVEKLREIELAPEQIIDSDNIHKNLSEYLNDFLSSVKSEVIDNPEKILSHVVGNLENISRTLNQKKKDFLINLSDTSKNNNYLGTIYLFFVLCLYNSTPKIVNLLSIDESDTFPIIEDGSEQARYILEIKNAKNFEEKAKRLRRYSDKMIESILSEIYSEIGLWLKCDSLKDKTLGAMKNELSKYEKCNYLLPFIFNDDFILIRNACAHYKNNFRINYSNNSIDIYERDNFKKNVTCEEIEQLLNELMVIYSGFRLAKILLIQQIDVGAEIVLDKLKIRVKIVKNDDPICPFTVTINKLL